MCVRFYKTQPRHCRWIEGKLEKDPLCCGKRVASPGASLCAEHKKLAYRPVPSRTGRRMSFSHHSGKR